MACSDGILLSSSAGEERVGGACPRTGMHRIGGAVADVLVRITHQPLEDGTSRRAPHLEESEHDLLADERADMPARGREPKGRLRRVDRGERPRYSLEVLLEVVRVLSRVDRVGERGGELRGPLGQIASEGGLRRGGLARETGERVLALLDVVLKQLPSVHAHLPFRP